MAGRNGPGQAMMTQGMMSTRAAASATMMFTCTDPTDRIRAASLAT